MADMTMDDLDRMEGGNAAPPARSGGNPFQPSQQTAASEATKIESQRAIAQVQGALVVARANPRNEMRAADKMREACRDYGLAEMAFYNYKRSGETVTGLTIKVATEFARCWGNIDYGIKETARAFAQSEMIAFAWDLEANTRTENSFIVEHIRFSRSGGRTALNDPRDIYENNANLSARRLRECILRALPRAIVDECESILRATLEEGQKVGGKAVPITKRREDALVAFAGIGVPRDRIEKRQGKRAEDLTAYDLANLAILFKSIRRGEVSKEDEFPDDRAANASAELRGKAAPQIQKEDPPRSDPRLTEEKPPTDDDPPAETVTEGRAKADAVIGEIQDCDTATQIDDVLKDAACTWLLDNDLDQYNRVRRAAQARVGVIEGKKR